MPRRGLLRSPHPTSPSHPFITVTESSNTDQAQGCTPTVPFASTPPTANQQQQQKRRTGFVCPMLLHASCPCEPQAHKDKEACGSGCATRAWGPGVGWDVWDVQWGAGADVVRAACAPREAPRGCRHGLQSQGRSRICACASMRRNPFLWMCQDGACACHERERNTLRCPRATSSAL